MSAPHLRWDRVGTWTLVTFTVSALLGFGPKLLGIPFKAPVSTVVSVLYMWVPGLVSIFFARRWYGAVRAPLGLRLKPSWWIVGAFAFPLAGALLSLALTPFMPGVTWTPDGSGLLTRLKESLPADQLALAEQQVKELGMAKLLAMTMAGGVLAGGTINALAALGEELGWRGLLYRELRPLGFWPSTLVTGLLWGAWHAPLILQGHNYPDAPVAGTFFMVLFCVSIAPMHAWSREKLDSVIAPSFTHGALNATGGAALFFVAADAPSMLVGYPGLPGVIAGGVIAGVIAVLRRRDPAVPLTASSESGPVNPAGT